MLYIYIYKLHMGGSMKIRLPKIPWSTDIIIFRFIYIHIYTAILWVSPIFRHTLVFDC